LSPNQQNGRLELFQLLHANRRIFLEETRSAPTRFAARLGDYGSVAEGGCASGSRAERNRPRVRSLRTIAARGRETAEEPCVLHGRSVGSRRRTTGSGRRQGACFQTSAAKRGVLARRAEKAF